MTLNIRDFLYLDLAGCQSPAGVVVFCNVDDLSFLTDLPNLSTCVVGGMGAGAMMPPATGFDIVPFDWMRDEAWEEAKAIQHLVSGAAHPELVFLARPATIPATAVNYLTQFGYTVFSALGANSLVDVPCNPTRAARQARVQQALLAYCEQMLDTRGTSLGTAGTFYFESGYCYRVLCQDIAGLGDDCDDGGRSRLVLFEDKRPLGVAHSNHGMIRSLGRGLYSHWRHEVFFSCSDNTSPNTNGRRYAFLEIGARPDNMERRLARMVGLKLSTAQADLDLALLKEGDGSKPPPPQLRHAGRSFAAWREQHGTQTYVPDADQRRVTLMIGYLGPGGAERQICNLARGMKAAGYAPELLTIAPLSDEGRHYADNLLSGADIPIDSLGDGKSVQLPQGPLSPTLAAASSILRRLPEEIRVGVLEATMRLQVSRPIAVVCYLDMINIVGGLAALLAGVPRILLSGRNVNPTFFPNLHRPWFREIYQWLISSDRVVLTANAEAGAESYACWLGIPTKQVKVIVNGIAVDDLPPPTLVQRVETRLRLGVGSSSPLIAGVFRLAQEKEPLLFVDVIARLRQRFPQLKAVVAGIGPLEGAMTARIQMHGIEDAIQLLGRCNDVHVLLGAADLLLHTAKAEGLPNVIMEAQWQGTAVVCTNAGGTRSALAPCLLPYMHAIGDIDALTKSCIELLADSSKRLTLASRAQREVHERFTVGNLVRNTLSALGLPPKGNMLPVQGASKPAPLGRAAPNAASKALSNR